jgi:hypothetical protein
LPLFYEGKHSLRGVARLVGEGGQIGFDPKALVERGAEAALDRFTRKLGGAPAE